jgi:hypothetical protein
MANKMIFLVIFKEFFFIDFSLLRQIRRVFFSLQKISKRDDFDYLSLLFQFNASLDIWS